MRCEDCPRFDSDRTACKDGKLNPLKWQNAVEVAQHFGIRAICMLNDHRERILDVYFGGQAQFGERPRTSWPGQIGEPK